MELLQSGRLFALGIAVVERLLATGAGCSVEEPDLRLVGRRPEPKRACDRVGDMVQVPAEVHFQFALLRRVELCGAHRQCLVLWALLPSRVGASRGRRRHRATLGLLGCPRWRWCCRCRTRWAPMAVGDHAVNAERLAAVVESDNHIRGVGDVGSQVSHVVHRVHRRHLAIDVDPAVRRGIGTTGWRGRGLALSARRTTGRARNLPHDDVAGPKLLRLDRPLHTTLLDVALAELLPALPGGSGGSAVRVAFDQLLRQGRHLLAGQEGLQPTSHPPRRDHGEQGISLLHVEAAQGHHLARRWAEILHHEQDHLVIHPARKLLWGFAWLWCQFERAHVIGVSSHTKDHQVRVAGVKVRGVELRNVRPEGACQWQETEAHLARIVSVLKREQRDVRPGHLHNALHLCGEITDVLVPAHLQALLVRDLGVIPEARHPAQVTLEDQFDLDLQLLLQLFPLPLLCHADLPLAPIHHLGVRGPRVRRRQDLSRLVLADVHQHVSVVDPWACGHLYATEIPGRALKVIPNAEVATCVVVVHCGKLTARRHGIVIELQPTALEVWADVSVVVPAVDVPTVNDDRIEQVHTSVGREV
mmetsp:Transcript_129327/g.322394  ORF Transcript_129327/g.322394 Transcript_129327/m.322394 type:complete len:587 (+) Transcript_129327:978-2738(+)